MSKMKHLLKKLHIGGGGVTGHQRLVDSRPVDSAPTVPPSSSSAIESDRGLPDASTSSSGGGGAEDYNLLEEEFQVQLALAISASDPAGDGSGQIDVAKHISLGCNSISTAPSVDSASPVDSLSLRYWSYNVVNYNEKVTDGFYDVHCVSPSSLAQGKMPSLMELQALDNFDYEVVVVNRLVDPKLRELEKRVYIMSLDSRFTSGLGFRGLIQKIADVVVQRMGGPVGDADEMSRRWKTRNSQLRTSLNSVILPLGCLDVGLSRHRALLFKVLADRVNLPCMLIKGSYYTGTDDGAVDLIRIDDGSELIIDLMGAPGTLIPVEVPSSHILNAGFGVRGFPCLTEATECSSFLPGDRPVTLAFPTSLGSFPEIDALKSTEALFPVVVTDEVTREDMLHCHPDKSFPCLEEDLISLMGDASSGKIVSGHKEEENFTRFPIEQQTDVQISLLSDTASGRLVFLHNREENGSKVDGTDFGVNFLTPSGMVENSVHENRTHESSLPSEMDSSVLPFKQTTNSDDKRCPQKETELCPDAEVGKQSGMKLIETERSNLVLGEGADWEIPWENLQIGERIGIGSYGEVYHAELNGTEVAVKKFLDQDFSGDALMQFKCEIEIMLRLRHPNVVLFMGAVTSPPNLSILTEFLPRGSLYRLLHRPNSPIDEKRRLRMAIDVAKGMNYLHTSHPTIVHRDLKSPNLLVDKNWVVKVCDFGLSRLKHHTFLSSKSTAGTPEWMAPEVLRNEPASEKCDIYSFGVILWELATCQIPWKGLNPMQVVGAVGFQNRRLEIPDPTDPSIARIIQDCWQMEPHLRPSFSQLIARLRRVQQLHIQKPL